MNMETFIAILNSSLVQTLVIIIGGYIITVFLKKKPEYLKYMGYIITAIKFAEKAIPDNSTHIGLQKMDTAMKKFIELYTQYEGKPPSKKLTAKVSSKMAMVHQDLELNGTLHKNVTME